MTPFLGCGPAAKLLAEDCFDMGTVAYQSGRYGQSRSWLNMADDLIRQGRHDGEVNRTQVLEYLAWIEYVVRKSHFGTKIKRQTSHKTKAPCTVYARGIYKRMCHSENASNVFRQYRAGGI